MNLVFFAVVVSLILKVSGIPNKTPNIKISQKAKEFLKEAVQQVIEQLSGSSTTRGIDEDEFCRQAKAYFQNDLQVTYGRQYSNCECSVNESANYYELACLDSCNPYDNNCSDWCTQVGCELFDGLYYWQWYVKDYVTNGDMTMKNKLPWYAYLLVAGIVGMC